MELLVAMVRCSSCGKIFSTDQTKFPCPHCGLKHRILFRLGYYESFAESLKNRDVKNYQSKHTIEKIKVVKS